MKKMLIFCFCIITRFALAIDIIDISEPAFNKYSDGVEIAMNTQGMAIAVWLNNNNNETEAKIEYVISSDFGNTWNSQKLLLDEIETDKINELKVFINDSNNIFCIWEKEQSDYSSSLESAISYDLGKTWNFHQLEKCSSCYSIQNIDNTILLTTIKHETEQWKKVYLIEVSKSTDFGLSWRTVKQIHISDFYGDSMNMELKETGQILLTWSEGPSYKDPKHYINCCLSNDFGENWSKPNKIFINNQTEDAIQNVLDDEGHAVIIWNELKKDNVDIVSFSASTFYSYSLDNGQTWSKAKILDKVEPGLENSTPVVSFESSKRVIVVWDTNNEEDNDQLIIKISTSNDYGKTWSSPVILSDKTKHCYDPKMLSTSKGHVLVVWNLVDHKTRTWITQARYSSDFGDNWSPIINLSNKSHYFKKQKIAMDSEGHTIIVWNQEKKNKVKYQAVISTNFGRNWK